MRSCVLCLCVVGLLAGPGTAQAEELASSARPTASEVYAPAVVVDEPPAPPKTTYLFEAAGRAAYTGTPIRGGVNVFGAGFGARAGFNFWHFYLGASVVDYLGGSDVTATDHALLAGVEVGYSLPVASFLTFRPLLGVGDAILSHTEPPAAGVDVVTSASGGSGGGSVTTQVKNIYVEPGLAALFTAGAFFGSLGGRALVVPGILYGPAPAATTTWVTYSFQAELGFRL